MTNSRVNPLILSLCLFISFLIVLFGRSLAPSDLYTHHQPRTAGYALDMYLNGRYFLPIDHQGNPATKPPMINWIGAGLYAMGIPTGHTLTAKFPAILGSIMTLFGIVLLGRDIGQRKSNAPLPHETKSPKIQHHPMSLGLLAATLWLASPSSFKLFDQLRPDIMLIGWMSLGLWLGVRLLNIPAMTETTSPPRNILTQLGFWFCLGAALLSKGPPALLLLLLIIIGTPVIVGSWRHLFKTGIVWGLPLSLAILGFWLVMAWQENPQHFKTILLSNEVFARILGVEKITTQELAATTSERGGPIGLLTTFHMTFFYYFKRFLPWSFIGILALWGTVGDAWLGRCFQLFQSTSPRWTFKRRLKLQLTDLRHRFQNHPAAPCFLWVFLAFAMFSLSAFKLQHYIAPAYPAAAVFVAYWLLYQAPSFLRKMPWLPAVIALLFCLGLSINHLAKTNKIKDHLGKNEIAFIQQIQPLIQDDPIVFNQTGYNSLQILMGHNQASDSPSPEQLAKATWLIQPVHFEPDRPAVAISQDLSLVIDGNKPGPLGLYRLKAE